MSLPAGVKPRERRAIVMCGLASTLVVATLALFQPWSLHRMQSAAYDAMLRSIPTSPPGDGVVIVDVDEQSLSSFGQWPWRRDLVARLIRRLRDMGASVVAIDIFFAEPDRSAPADVNPDDVLAQTLREGRVVLGYAMTFDNGSRRAGACPRHPLGLAIVHPPKDTGAAPFFQATGAVCNLPALADAAGASGFLNAAPDADGILRRVPLVLEHDGQVYPGLALASVVAVSGAGEPVLRVFNSNSVSLAVADREVPLDGRSNLLLRYRGERQTFPYVSAVDVLEGRAAADRVRGRIVFLGTTALGTREVVATPLDTLFSGVEVQATIADNLLRQDFLRRTAGGAAIETAVVLLFGGSLTLLMAWGGLVAGLIGAAAGVMAIWFGTLWHLSVNGAVLSPLYPVVGVVLGLATMTIAKVVAERRRADLARSDKITAQRLMVQSLLSLTETRDEETGRHSLRTQLYTRVLADRLARYPRFREYLTPERVDLLSRLAPLHDIGKVGIPDHILNKPGVLTPEELAQMRTHPSLGREVIAKAEQQVGVRDDAILEMAKLIVYTHHERWDGSGYPQGLRGADIPIEGRVLAIVDVYDALVTRALYRIPMSHDDAVNFITRHRGTHFDPDVVDAFEHVAAEFRRVSSEVALPSL